MEPQWFQNRTLKVTNLEYDYINAIEHVNSIYNLISIIRHNYKDKIIENFLPFKIKSADLNLFYNVHIVKQMSLFNNIIDEKILDKKILKRL